jgi:hypothetical protein
MMAYALGRRVEYYDEPSIRAIMRATGAGGYKIPSIILGVIKTDAFRMRLAEPVNEPDKPAGRR